MDVDVLNEIFKYFNLKQLISIKSVNKLFNQLSSDQIKNIIDGNIYPDDYFDNHNIINDEYNYPISSLFNNEGYWSINHVDINKDDIVNYHLMITKLYFINNVYYYQYGENDGNDWILIGKIDDFYIVFEASCDYTGFDCQGGGEFNYSKNWKNLWNKYTSDIIRKMMLNHYGYQYFKISM